MTFCNISTNFLNTSNIYFGTNDLFSQFNTFTPTFGMFNPFSMNSFMPFNSSYLFNWNMPLFSNINTSPVFTSMTNYSFIPFTKWSTDSINYNNYSFCSNNATFAGGKNFDNSQKHDSFGKYSRNVSGNINNNYANLSKSAAYQKALNDSNLENLSSGGNRWQISTASFRTDIPFAKKGTGKILDKVASNIGCDLVVTSALGTGQAGNPHQRGGYVSHHNADNPKLDLKIPSGMSSSSFAKKLKNTGYFSHVLNEGDHIDVQIDPEKYNSLDQLA